MVGDGETPTRLHCYCTVWQKKQTYGQSKQQRKTRSGRRIHNPGKLKSTRLDGFAGAWCGRARGMSEAEGRGSGSGSGKAS